MTPLSLLVYLLYAHLHRCSCILNRLYMPIPLKDPAGKIIRTFDRVGLDNVEFAIYRIMRDLFMVMLTSGSEDAKKQVPVMLRDLDEATGWQGLEKVLLGGESCTFITPPACHVSLPLFPFFFT